MNQEEPIQTNQEMHKAVNQNTIEEQTATSKFLGKTLSIGIFRVLILVAALIAALNYWETLSSCGCMLLKEEPYGYVTDLQQRYKCSVIYSVIVGAVFAFFVTLF